jgi:hypothetical protein
MPGAIALLRGAALCALCASCAAVVSPPPASGPEAGPAPTHAGPPSVSALVDEVVRRVVGSAKPGERIAILLQLNDERSPIALAVRAALAREPRVVFSVIRKRELGPVPTPETATGHTNAEDFVCEPRAALVLLIREDKESGVTYVASRDAGPDPLAPPSSWTWTLEIATPR